MSTVTTLVDQVQTTNDNSAHGGHSSERSSAQDVARRAFTSKLRSDTERKGFGKWSATEFASALGPDSDLGTLIEAARTAPADKEDAYRHRYRRFGSAYFFPWQSDFTPVVLPPFTDTRSGEHYTRFSQPAIINPEAGGRERRFAPISADVWRAMWPVVRCFYDATPHELVSRTEPVLAHAHIVDMRPDANWAAYSVPNLVHRDLDPTTFVLLLERSTNAAGGSSVVARSRAAKLHANWQDLPEGEILEKFTLTESGSGFVVWDERVSHAVTPVYGADGEPANRSALLLDFANTSL